MYNNKKDILKSIVDIIDNPITFNIKSYTIPDNVKIIDKYAFLDCKILESITIPNNVKYIAEYAFYGCGNLKSITIPNSVTEISVNIFNRHYYIYSNLKYIAIPNKHYKTYQFCNITVIRY